MIARIFSAPLANATHVRETIVREAKRRMVEGLDPAADLRGAGDLRAHISRLREIDGLGRADSNPLLHMHRALPEAGLIERGLPSGYPKLDACLPGGGVGPGHLAVAMGDTGGGKTRLLCNVALHAARVHHVNVLYECYEGGAEDIQRRLVRAALRRKDIVDWQAAATEAFGLNGDPRGVITIRFAPEGEWNTHLIDKDIDQVEQETGRKVGLVIRDYGELEAIDSDYKSVVKVYRAFKAMLTRRGLPGWDAMQKNRYSQASYFDIWKPVNVVLDLTEEDSRTTSMRIVKNRGGPKLVQILLRVYPEYGKVEEALVVSD